MAKNNSDGNLVDISSNTQVIKLYNKKGRVLRIVTLVLSVIFFVTGVVYAVGYGFLHWGVVDQMKTVETKRVSDSKVTDANAIKTPQQLDNDSVLNVMLFGEDDRRGSEYGRTDTMILLSVDSIHKKLKLTSFQRDTYVYIPGGQDDPGRPDYDKINASYTYGGAELAIKTIETNFGVRIDKYAIVDFQGFKDIINKMGGVEIELNQEEIDYINYQMYKNKQVDERYTITEKPGKIKLNGQEALWYARDRGLTKGEDGNEIGLQGDDWDRTSRQRKLLETVVGDLKKKDPVTLVNVATSIGPMITTNMTKDQITLLLTYVSTLVNYEVVQNYVPQQNLWYYNSPGDKSWDTSGSCIMITDMKAQREALAEFIYEY